MQYTLPSSDELRLQLQSTLQETDTSRLLDSIENVAVQAYLSRWELQVSSRSALPATIEGWVEWVARCSMVS